MKILIEKAVIEQALVALEDVMTDFDGSWALADTAITALREALAERAEQEPVAKVVLNRANQITMQKPNGDYFDISKHVGEYFYAAPVRTKDLTDDEELELARSSVGKSRHWLVAAAIATYKEKNK